MKKILNLFKKRTPPPLPQIQFDDNWKQEYYHHNVKVGVSCLQRGTPVVIYDDGRGYELALDIKRTFMLEYQKSLAEKIKIETGGSSITISFKP